jgi:prepilin-type N-terminal cleavage/methylation domain-containing protein
VLLVLNIDDFFITFVCDGSFDPLNETYACYVRDGHSHSPIAAIKSMEKEVTKMNKSRTAFTLIELVVVIMILGILAGVAAPKMFRTSQTASENGLRQTLAVVRNAIELYAAEAGEYPTAPANDLMPELRPYLQGNTFPGSPIGAGDSTISVSAADPLVADDTSDWMYNATTGEFISNTPPYDTW